MIEILSGGCQCGSFDDATRFRPTHNHAAASMLPALAEVGRLPGIPSHENAAVVERWRAAGLEPPE